MKKNHLLTFLFTCLIVPAFANKNVPAANVTITDNGTTVVLNNGIITATITKSTAAVETLSYNGYDMLSGGYSGGKVYWSWNMPNYQNPSGCTYSVTANPTNNNGDYAEIKLRMTWNGSASTAAIDVDVYYSLRRGVSGLYASSMLSHPASYPANPGGEWRMASYIGSTFDWMSVDSLRNRKMASPTSSSVAVTGAPKEVTLWTSGLYANQYECKYDYSADFGDIDVWGWSSTTKNIGIWVTAPSKEYYNGGPMKRELMCHQGPTLLNMLGGTHYTMGSDTEVDSAEVWKKMYGPFLIYCNSVPTGTANAPIALWNDAQTQAKIEQAQWPYSWFNNVDYVKANGRGTVTGKLIINDTTITNSISAANMWVGVAIPPKSTNGVTDFQLWSKNFQFWVKTDANGNFTIPHVLPGTYNIYAFGPAAAGQMTKTAYVTVTAGTTTNLGDVIWVPTRIAPTIWEIGIPDRSAQEFKHGTDWWTSNIFPSKNWAKFMDYPDEFPNDVNFTIGKSNIATDWNFVQNYDNTVQAATPLWKVTFNLTDAPKTGTNSAAIYTAFAAAFNSAIIVKVNGTLITSSTGTYPPNQSNAKIRKGIHGAFGDLRLPFNGNLLKAGINEISFSIRNTGGATIGDIMYDYVRLEASGTSLVTTTLPVVLQPLKVAKQGNAAVLSWATTTEVNNDYFEVQKSLYGNTFYDIGKVLSKGNSSIKIDYSFADIQPLNGINYYRLKQVDKDGKTVYSNVVNANFSFNTSTLQVLPNPANNKLLINYSALQPSILAFDIIDDSGKIVKSFTINAETGKNDYLLDVSALQSGFHFVKLSDGNRIVTKKFLKQ